MNFRTVTVGCALLLAALTLISPGTVSAQYWPAGPRLTVNDVPDASQFEPDIALFSDGSYVVVWATEPILDETKKGIFFQRFSRNDEELGPEQRVTDSFGHQPLPAVRTAADDSFCFVWNYGGLRMRCYDSVGFPRGPELLAVSGPYNELQPLSRLADGSLLLTYAAKARDGAWWFRNDTYARRFSQEGQALSPEVLVNGNNREGSQWHSAAAVRYPDNSSVVFYGSNWSGAYAQRLDPDLSPVGPPIGPHGGLYPNVAMAADGSFVLLSRKYFPEAVILLRLYGPDGLPRSEILQVNTMGVSSSGTAPAVAMAADGSFVVAWRQDGHLFYRPYDSAASPLADQEVIVNDHTVGHFPNAAITPDGGSFLTTWSQEIRRWVSTGWTYDNDVHVQRLTSISGVATIVEDMASAGEIENAGLANGIIALLNKADNLLDTNREASIRTLDAAIRMIEAQRGHGITEAAADRLLAILRNILASFEQ